MGKVIFSKESISSAKEPARGNLLGGKGTLESRVIAPSQDKARTTEILDGAKAVFVQDCHDGLCRLRVSGCLLKYRVALGISVNSQGLSNSIIGQVPLCFRSQKAHLQFPELPL